LLFTNCLASEDDNDSIDCIINITDEGLIVESRIFEGKEIDGKAEEKCQIKINTKAT
jgi:hypothetical protein